MAKTLRPAVATAALAGSGSTAAPERLSDRLDSHLTSQIEHGMLCPGDRLPTEAQLAVSHGVSRSVVREAVHRVKARGLLVARQGSGVFVAPKSPHQPLAFDPAVLESMNAVVQVVELRRVLEGETAALAAQRATRSQIADLKRSLKAIDTATDAGQNGLDEDMAFHRAIGAATGNPQFNRLLIFLEQYLREAMRVTKANEARHADFMCQVRNEHHAIVAAIAAHDPVGAREAAIGHLNNGERRLEEGGVVPGRHRKASRHPTRNSTLNP